MYASVHDQPPPALLPHSVTSSLVVPASRSATAAAAATKPLSSGRLVLSSPHDKHYPPFLSSFPPSSPSSSFYSSSSTSSPVSSLPYPRLLSQPHLLQKSGRLVTRTPPGRSSRRAVLDVQQMYRSPYSRETTDISDQELRQILDSENISGLPAPYCLVPHFEAHFSPARNAQQQQQQQIQHAPSSATQHYYPAHTQTGPIVGQGGGSSLGSIGGHDSTTAGNTTTQPDSGAAGVVHAQSSTSAAAQTNEATRRRTRTTLTPYQLRVLFRVWERTQYPSSDLRFRLATSLMMTPRNVQIWFQNQRQKTKERAEMRRRTHSPSLNPSAMSGVSASTAPQGQQRQALHIHPQPPAHFVESHTRDEHVGAIMLSGRSPPESPFRYSHVLPSAIPLHSYPAQAAAAAAASSLPVRHALLQHHDSAAASAAGTVPHSQNSSPVPVSYSMLTPPALYSQSFSQQQQHLPALYSHHSHNMQSLPPHQQTQPQTPLNPAHPHMHHQRHASQPHPVHYLQPQAALASASKKASEATTKSKGSVFSPQDSSLHQSPRPLATPKQNEADASEVNATAKCTLQLPPPLHTSHGQIHFSEHNIPSPATPTLVSEKHGIQQPPSPLASRLRHPSPPLTTPMALMSMSPQGLAIDQIPSSETRQHPANGRARLADILNPITSYDMQSSSCAPQDVRMNQSGPLPSLGSLLASVQKDANSPLAGDGTRNTLSQSRSSSSIVSTSAPPNKPSPAANKPSSGQEKWRPW